MNEFAKLYKSILTSSDQQYKAELIREYLTSIPDKEKLIAIELLSENKWPALISSKALVQLTEEHTRIPAWLMQSCYAQTKDWVETCTLILQNPHRNDNYLNLETWQNDILSKLVEIRKSKPQINSFLIEYWNQLPANDLWIFNKIITGTLKPMLNHKMMAEILSGIWQITSDLLNLRLCLYKNTKDTLEKLLNPEWSALEKEVEPVIFFEPAAWTDDLLLENAAHYLVDEFIHGRRMQVLKTADQALLYDKELTWQASSDSKHKEWIETLPYNSHIEFIESEHQIMVTDIYKWKKLVSDNLTWQEKKIIIQNWSEENDLTLNYSQPIELIDWAELQDIKNEAGWIIKHKTIANNWFRIKPKPYELWTVLLYAETDRQGSMDFKMTLAIKNEENSLVPVAKIDSSCLSPTDSTALFYWIQNNTFQKFGPVKTVRSNQFFKISFDRLQINKKVKAGFKLINVKIIHWIKVSNMKVSVSGTDELKALL
ncbi:MAG: hypothetical protein ABI844_14810 [Saprospiraceae bacterium]